MITWKAYAILDAHGKQRVLTIQAPSDVVASAVQFKAAMEVGVKPHQVAVVEVS